MSIEFTYTQEEVNILCQNYYEKGRSDAIEDCIKSIQKQFEYRDNQGLPHYALYAWINITSVRNMLEQLKEQK